MATPFVPYNPGTITVTNGSVNFTGSGTMLTAYEVGDAIIVDGNLCRIATIASNTAGTFALVYPGTSGAGKVYDWMPAADVTRALTLYASFQRLLVGGNLAAEAAIDGTGGNWLSYFTGAGTKARTALTAWGRSLLGLTMAVDKVPYGVDANTMALMTVSAAARTVLDDADVAAMRATLGTVAKAGDNFTGTIGAGSSGNKRVTVGHNGTVGSVHSADFGTAESPLQLEGASVSLMTGVFSTLARLAIDGDGRVNLPYQPSFMAAWGSGISSGNFVTGYSTPGHNVGGHFNATNGRFTAPVAGKYLLAFRFKSSISGTCGMFLYKNGATLSIGSEGTPDAYSSDGVVVVLDLAANDYVQLFVNVGTTHNNAPYNRFSGQLLS